MSKEKPRKRTKIKGHYMQVRQRSTEKGKKGTIMAKWKSDKSGKKRIYRCKLPISSRLQRFCGHKKAGSHCLEGGDRRNICPQLVTAYQ
ncbi:MAG: hypothetical protein OEY39_03080 [Candidatus Bathyarchaeota archaeon]|nr:hypothetical protein [Candidatus Bathyarchaeota archaeon]MDH5419671.1 hypothetical protein [Candidatus Bathyarchaeota archaeon]MDH5623431.1 hypothetical protein [Candidatus Bathyarchaeota archaeon]MDH5635998.1 hypothetical protein [Candidatus Bathyarchaeota archaeon]MDH5702526.1 hypothetical protein [Candidatus Bathyarchaeota archaeon]